MEITQLSTCRGPQVIHTQHMYVADRCSWLFLAHLIYTVILSPICGNFDMKTYKQTHRVEYHRSYKPQLHSLGDNRNRKSPYGTRHDLSQLTKTVIYVTAGLVFDRYYIVSVWYLSLESFLHKKAACHGVSVPKISQIHTLLLIALRWKQGS